MPGVRCQRPRLQIGGEIGMCTTMRRMKRKAHLMKKSGGRFTTPVHQLKRGERIGANDPCPCGETKQGRLVLGKGIRHYPTTAVPKKFKECCRVGIFERAAKLMTVKGIRAMMKDYVYARKVRERNERD